MHIGIDATCWQNSRGYGRHARALLSALVRGDRQNRYTFFMDSRDQADSVPSEAEIRFTRSSSPTTMSASANGHRGLGDMWRMSRAMSDGRLDLLLFPTIYSFVPVLSRTKKIVMIHDVIAETYPQLTLPRRTSRLFWRAKVAAGRRQASALVTVSEHSRRGIVEHFGVDPRRVFVVGEAADPVFRAIDDPTPTPRLVDLGVSGDRRHIVYVGGFNPHKNLLMLVDQFAQLVKQDDLSDVRMVMVGPCDEVFHSYFGTVKQRVDELGIADRVVFTGFLADSELPVLLNLATVLVLPSLLEGYGLPAVEAAACGLPVIATTASPLPDLLAGGGLFVDPLDGDGWRDALQTLLRSPELRARMGKAGRAAAGQLTWDAAARQMIDVFRQVAA